MTAVKDNPRPTLLRIATPLGLDLEVGAADGHIVSSRFVRRSRKRLGPSESLLREAERQLNLYFKGSLERFTLPLHFEGTPFECDVWRCVAQLRFGEFASYADVARAVGRPLAHRGVARAMGRTSLALFVPAHRIVGADGKPRGLSPKGTRAWLIRFEKEKTSARRVGDEKIRRTRTSANPSPSRRARTAR